MVDGALLAIDEGPFHVSTIRAKLIAAFTAVVILMASVAAYATWSARDINRSANQRYVKEALPLRTSIDDFVYQILSRQDNAIVVTALNIKAAEAGFKAADAKASQDLTAARATALAMGNDRFVAQLDAIGALNTTLAKAHVDAIAAYNERGQAAGLKELLKPADLKAYYALTASVTKLQKDTGRIVAQSQARQSSKFSTTLLIVLSLLGAGVLCAAGICFFFVQRLSGSLRPVVDAARKLASGDVSLLSGQSGKRSNDEIGAVSEAFSSVGVYLGEMADAADRIAEGDLTVIVTPRSAEDRLGQAFARMTTTLSEVVAEISAHANTLRHTTEGVTVGSAQTGRAVDEIAHALAGVAAGAERQVRMATDAQAASEEAQRTADDGVGTAHRMAGVIGALGEKSEAIGGIVSTIQGLAGQTNLLALNAAIEAARAGEQGRGFAVVAEEVRKLAEESQKAAGSIADLIGEIKVATDQAVEVVGTEASTAFTRIASGTRSAHAALSEVASVAEQTSAATQEVSASTQETSASALDLAGAARELVEVSEQLDRVVERFTTR